MDKFKRTKIITKVVWNSLLIVVGVFLWIGGLTVFIEDKNFLNWLVWGIITTPFIIPFVIEMIKDQAKRGKQEGANTYTATQIGNTVTVSNNPMGGMIKGAFIGLIGGVLGGPIMTPIFSIKRLLSVIENIQILVKTKE